MFGNLILTEDSRSRLCWTSSTKENLCCWWHTSVWKRTRFSWHSALCSFCLPRWSQCYDLSAEFFQCCCCWPGQSYSSLSPTSLLSVVGNLRWLYKAIFRQWSQESATLEYSNVKSQAGCGYSVEYVCVPGSFIKGCANVCAPQGKNPNFVIHLHLAK